MKRFLWAALAVAVLIPSLWIVALPESVIIGLIENAPKGGMTARAEGFEKGLFFNFRAERIAVVRGEDELLSLENVRGKLNPFSLMLFRLTLSLEGDVAGGRLEGSVNAAKGKTIAWVKVAGAQAEDMPFFKAMGLDAKGILNGEIDISGARGDIKFSVTEALIAGRSFSGVHIPLDLFYTAKGAMSIEGDTLTVTSFTFEGVDIYARVKGTARGAEIDLTVEIMPEAAFNDRSLALMPLEQYKISPGYYQVPAKGKLSPE